MEFAVLLNYVASCWELSLIAFDINDTRMNTGNTGNRNPSQQYNQLDSTTNCSLRHHHTVESTLSSSNRNEGRIYCRTAVLDY